MEAKLCPFLFFHGPRLRPRDESPIAGPDKFAKLGQSIRFKFILGTPSLCPNLSLKIYEYCFDK